MSYLRNAAGKMHAIALDNEVIISAIKNLPFGPFKKATLGTIPLTRGYDQRYNLMTIQAGSLLYTYTRDAAGHVTSIENLPAPDVAALSEEYSYNAANNQLTVKGTTTYSYDALGNMTNDGLHTFSYDELNRITEVSKNGQLIARYGYDSSNRRILKTAGDVTTHYHYDSNNRLIAETLADGTPLRDYIYLDGEPIAVNVHQGNAGLYYYINDHLGTPQQLIDSAGAIVWQAAYLPFGEAQMLTEKVVNNLRFPGQYFDSETGLHYNWNRYYDPETGRYTSADPIGLDGGMNLYSYVQNDPVNNIDPRGLAYSKSGEHRIGSDGVISPEKRKQLKCESKCTGEAYLGYIEPTLGGIGAVTGPFRKKARRGISGGGLAGWRTSVVSQYAHKKYITRQWSKGRTQLVRYTGRFAWPASSALGSVFYIYDTIKYYDCLEDCQECQ